VNVAYLTRLTACGAPVDVDVPVDSASSGGGCDEEADGDFVVVEHVHGGGGCDHVFALL
jgi:hypothetical protein